MGGWSTLKKDAAYCYPCCMFGSTSISTSRPENVLLPLGFMIGSMLLVRKECFLAITTVYLIMEIVSLNILGLKFNERYVKDEDLNSLRYGKLMIMADPNPDGTFLRVS